MDTGIRAGAGLVHPEAAREIERDGARAAGVRDPQAVHQRRVDGDGSPLHERACSALAGAGDAGASGGVEAGVEPARDAP